MKTKDIAELQTILNHANQADTLMCICILQEKINKNTSDFDLLKNGFSNNHFEIRSTALILI